MFSREFITQRHACHLNEPKLRFKAAVFDLDGVVTQSASLHALAWKQLFDEFLQNRKNQDSHNPQNEEKYKEFQINPDYYRYIDGVPRYSGVKNFLTSRGIDLEFGDSSDPPNAETICGLGNRKNVLFTRMLEDKGVIVYESTMELIKLLKKKNVKIAVASASKNCKKVLQLAKIEHYFDVVMDGAMAEALRLRGKPSGDIFVQSCRMLDVPPEKAILVEDAINGVRAGKDGKFGLVIGLDRADNREALLEGGADLVVKDLRDLSIWSINDACPCVSSSWTLNFDLKGPATEKLRETLTGLGNGYFLTRGAAEEALPEEENVRYPGTYIAGGYNRVKSNVEGKTVETEDLVNFPNWTRITFRKAGGEWFSWESKQEILSYDQKLNMKEGIMVRRFRVKDAQNSIFTITSQRMVHLRKRHLGVIKYSIIAENWEGDLEVRAMLDGSVRNRGVERYKGLNSKHLEVVAKGSLDPMPPNSVYLHTRTLQSRLHVGMVSKIQLFIGEEEIKAKHTKVFEEDELIGQVFTIPVKAGNVISIEKIVAICTGRDRGIVNPVEGAITEILRCREKRFHHLLATHVLFWKSVWARCDIHLEEESSSSSYEASMVRLAKRKPWTKSLSRSTLDYQFNHSELLRKFSDFAHGDRTAINAHDLQFVIRFNAFHLIQTMFLNCIGIDTSVPARGLHGEAYRGHIFWDELFFLAASNLRLPEVSRSMLLYRFYRLDAAKDRAKEMGLYGACYPWQSASTGREETPNVHFNPISKKWGPDFSHLQLHVNIAIFYNIWSYFRVTGDLPFMSLYGAEMILEIARFWGQKAIFNQHTGRYEIHGVMGPDEFHERYPGNSIGGLRNNAYTNIMVAWCLDKVFLLMELISARRRAELRSLLHLSDEELAKWKHITEKMTVIFHDDMIISQFEGWHDLKELDWEAYREKYRNIQRLDRILKAEGDSPDNYKVCKQADTCMLFYLLTDDEIISVLKKMGYPFNRELIKQTVYYYLQRTSHGSTLSWVVFSYILYDYDIDRAWHMYKQFVMSDVCDIQMGTTAEGIHIVPMASSLNMLLYKVIGIDTSEEAVKIDPHLPKDVTTLSLSFQYKHQWLYVFVSHSTVQVSIEEDGLTPVPFVVKGRKWELMPGSSMKLDILAA